MIASNPLSLPATILCGLGILVSTAAANNWPRFRGPNGSGISQAQTVPVRWTMNDYKWVVSLPGEGHSSPVTWGPRIFVTSADEEQGQRFLTSLDQAGKVLWQRQLTFAKYKHHKNNSSASSTPAVDDDHVYVLWHGPEETPLIAYDHQGRLVWQVDLGQFRNGQGGASSPMVYEDLVFISNDHTRGSALYAFDRKTGEQVWKVPRAGKRACYSTPCVFAPEPDQPQIIFSHCFEGILGVDPKTGAQKWQIDVFGTHPQRAVASPFVWKDVVYASSGAGGGERNVVGVRATSDAASEVFRVSRTAPHVTTPIIYQDLMFLWGDRGIVNCVQVKDGSNVWLKRVGGNFFGSPVCVNGKLYCVELNGTVIVLDASAEYQLLARNPLGQPSRSTPAVGNGVMYIRSYSNLFAIGGE